MGKSTHTALITGATSGIGLELAKLFARDNYSMVLVARDEVTLGKVREDLMTLGAHSVKIIAKDLSVKNSAEEVFMETSMEGIHVEVLVNDAGIGQHGLFNEIPLEKDLEIIHLNIVSLVTLTKLYLTGMVERGQGHILQLASDNAYFPTPQQAVYAASKSFVMSFTDSLVKELRGTGVTVTALIPGPTDTDFYNKSEAENTPAEPAKQVDPAIVAKIGYNAMVNGVHHALGPGAKKSDCI